MLNGLNIDLLIINMETKSTKVCLICNETRKDDFSQLTQDSLTSIQSYSVRWNALGKYKDVFDRTTGMTFCDTVHLYYHRKCYQSHCHKGHLNHAEEQHQNALTDAVSNKKRGRPSETDYKSFATQKSRKTFDDKTCVFCQVPGNDEVFAVSSDDMGNKFLQFKLHSKSEDVRARLAFLVTNTDAFAQNMKYHRNCLREETRNLEALNRPLSDSSQFAVPTAICDLEFISIARHALTPTDKATMPHVDMNTFSDTYKSLLMENCVPFAPEDHFKRHIKSLLNKYIPDVEFVKRGPKPEEVFSSATKTLILQDYCTTEDAERDMTCLMKAAAIIRQEISKMPEWKYTGVFSDFQVPTKLCQLMEWIIAGMKERLDVKRDKEIQTSSRNLAQYVMNNFRTNRQVQYQSLVGRSFQKHRETPLSVGTSLMLYQKNRSKGDIDIFFDLSLSTTYEFVQTITNTIARNVVSHTNEKQTVLLPSFVKRGIRPIFSADNVDFGSDAGSFHGADLMIAQKSNSIAPFVLQATTLLDRSESSRFQPVAVDLKYINCNKNINPDICFSSPVCLGKLKPGYSDDVDEVNILWLLLVFEAVMNVEGPTETSKSDSMDMGNVALDNNEATDDSFVNDLEALPAETFVDVQPQQKLMSKKEVIGKVPTWAAFNSRISNPVEECAVGVVAPLYNRSPTDWSVLQTILTHAQQLNDMIVEKEGCRPIITLDGDLYDRAVKMKDYKKFRIIRLGALHTVMASLKCLGKYIEGSGIDSAWEIAGVYGSATVRQIIEGRHVYRGIEAHVVTVVAVFSLFVDSLLSEDEKERMMKILNNVQTAFENEQKSNSLSEEVSAARKALIEADLITKVKDNMGNGDGVCKFLKIYIKQVLNLLAFISATRNADWELHLSSLEEMCIYFHAHDQQNYGRWAPLYISDMRELQTTDPDSWKFLKDGNFVITKSTIPFTSLDPDHAIEQEHKKMKIRGGVIGITGNTSALDKYFIVAPILGEIVNDFKSYAGINSVENRSIHHESFGGKGCKIINAAAKLSNALSKEGNPFLKSDLHNLMTFSVPPQKITHDTLNRDNIGRDAFEKFVDQRLVSRNVKFWDSQKRNNFTFFKDTAATVRTKVSGEIVNLKQERTLISRLLVVAKTRPDLVPKDAIGEYEFHVSPPSNFNQDGTMHMLSNKHELVAEMYSLPTNTPIVVERPDVAVAHRSVLLIDAMCVVQSFQVDKTIKCVADLAVKFVAKVHHMAIGYNEVRVLFDQYIEGSLKERTRDKRTKKSVSVHYHVNDSTEIKNVAQFLSHIQTKAELTVYLAKKLLVHYEYGEQKILVAYSNIMVGNRPLTDIVTMNQMQEGKHSLEEADHQIVLHSIDIAQNDPETILDVYSLDTDVFVLLTAFYPEIPAATTLLRLNDEKLSIPSSYNRIGAKHAKALIGWYSFKGTDNTGGFVSKALNSHFKAFLASDDDILSAFAAFGNDQQVSDDIFKQMERYVCLLYKPANSKFESLIDLRWVLFAKFGKEGRQLPPTKGTLVPHTRRAYYHALVLKKSTLPCPNIPKATDFSWIEKDGQLHPEQCTVPPAPEALLVLRKCGCTKGCKNKICSCRKSCLPCTDLCDCEDNCSNRNNTVEDIDGYVGFI